MFERRLKILLGIIIAVSVVLLGRAVQMQVLQVDHWRNEAADMMQHIGHTETQRGRILDRNGHPLAFDTACIDAAVDYRAISLDPRWIKEQARSHLKHRLDPLPTNVKPEVLLEDEEAHVKSDIEQMWTLLANVSGKNIEDIEETRQQVMQRVLYLKRDQSYRNYEKSGAASQPSKAPWYKRWLKGLPKDDADDEHTAALDASMVDIQEERLPQVILHNISDEVQAKLRKAMDRCPGLQLIAGTRRQYDPVAAVTAEHVLGNMTLVSDSVIKNDPFLSTEPLRKYYERDQIGGSGLERLAEPILRGSRGEKEYVSGSKDPKELNKPVPGRDVRSTIDLDLQNDVAVAFNQTYTPEEVRGVKPQTFSHLHGAAVVIKVDESDNQVLAMYSNPGFDLNHFDDDFGKLERDNLNKPLLNRATQQAFQPGSTVKTIIGSIAVTRGLLTRKEGIKCDGFLRIPDLDHPGKMYEPKARFRCWTARLMPLASPEQAAFHAVPWQDPHVGRYNNPNGYLCLADAIERSCNVYFETVAGRLRMGGVVDALSSFGLGQRTGIGIAESPGFLPKPTAPSGMEDELCLSAGIGEEGVAATPIQMATVAATIARRGIWMRPKLLMGDAARLAEQYQRSARTPKGPDVVDLHLSPDAIDAVQEGMINVVNRPFETGPEAHMDELTIAGKTGSAQVDAKELDVPVLGDDGRPVHDPDSQGHAGKGPVRMTVYKPGDLPWLQGTGENREHLAHAWFIGFAPAQKPRIAFCVLVEYGGSGGRVAGPIAKAILMACLKHHYLDATTPVARVAVYRDPSGELLHPQ
jgi:penicillin-binding protein 2